MLPTAASHPPAAPHLDMAYHVSPPLFSNYLVCLKPSKWISKLAGQIKLGRKNI